MSQGCLYGCTSATGAFIQPMLIFPRVRFLPELIDKAPTGTIEKATKSVWINSEISNEWCDHSAQQIQPTHRTQSALLILDDHSIHTMNLGLIRKAREKNDTTVSNLLTVPANCRR